MLETPLPTLEELRDLEPLVNGDIGAAQDELVRRLRLLLPDWIDAKNEANNWTGSTATPAIIPSDITLAPAVLTDDHIGKILVKVEVETTPEGIGGAFRNHAKVSIFSIDERIQSGQQVRVHWRRAEAIRLCLFPFLSGCVNAGGVRVWRSLVPTTYTLLTGEWAKQYSGTVATFQLIQPPSESY
ncbi:hypothetical protein IAD21_00688 [Abditibacteriota bacterium]|nr:hypothetical protein IAD21_00688 [Abditibacteriota bacterium]